MSSSTETNKPAEVYQHIGRKLTSKAKPEPVRESLEETKKRYESPRMIIASEN